MTAIDPVPTIESSAILPLMSGQYGMWLQEQLHPHNPALSTAGFVDIEGPVDAVILQRATELAFYDSECLRTRMVINEGIPGQWIDPEPIAVDLADFSDFPAPLVAAADWASRQMATALPLAKGGVRATVIKLAERHATVYLEGHHIKWDGVSGAIVTARIAQRYQWLLDGTEPEQWPSYAELVAEDLAYLASERHAIDGEYWRSTIDATLPITALYTGDWVHPQGELRRSTAFSAQWHENLRNLARSARTTWHVLGFALSAAYIARRIGQREVTLTIPVARRTTEVSRALPGMLANFLPLRVAVRPDEDIVQLASRISRDVKGLTKAQRYPAGEVRRLIGLESDDLRPLGPSVNILSYVGETPMGEAVASIRDLSTGPVEDLQFEFQETASGEVRLHLNVNPQLHSPADAEQMLADFVGFLEAALAQPLPALGSIALLPRVLEASGQTDGGEIRGADAAVPALDLLARLRAAEPSALCLVDTDGSGYSHQKLLGLVAALRRDLSNQGFVAGSVLAVEAVPSARLVAAILAVWSLGGAYFPVAADTGVERLRHLLDSTEAVHLLAASEQFGRTAVEAQPRLRLIDEGRAAAEQQVIEQYGESDQASDVVPISDQAAAYIIFTSGSTGLPKGAVVSRRGMMNHLLAKVEDLELGVQDMVAMTAPLTFDISIWQIFAPLLAGSVLRLVDRQVATDRDALLSLTETAEVTVLEIVPSLLRTMVEGYRDGDELAKPESLRLLMVTGEELPLEVARLWHSVFPQIPVVNAYGPTECSDDVTHGWLGSAETAATAPGERAPIGRALRNTSLYILDEFLRPVQPGQSGELYVGGTGVGIGYAADPARTSAAFTANPWGGSGARMYRTGDIVRQRTDGQLEFLGRQDHQVKIRGFRIELGEVETAIRAIDGVADVVVATHGQGLRRGLVAYVLPADSVSEGGTEWFEQQLEGRIPSYMKPDVWFLMEAMPLTANGKVDRKSLPEPETPDRGLEIDQGTADVRAIGEHFADILELERIGQDESFFDLGGNSLLATRLVTVLRTRAQLSVSLADIFAHPTPQRLAAATQIAESLQGHRVPILAQQSGPLSHGQRRLHTLASLDPEDPSYHLGLTLRLDQSITTETLDTGLRRLLQRHRALRTRIGFDGKNTVQLITEVPERVLRTESLPGRDLRAVIQAEMDRPFDLEEELPIRFLLLDGVDTRSLVIVAHHIACDGWSFRILAEDLSAMISGTELSSSAGPDYLDYARWQTSEVANETAWVRADEEFWSAKLAGGFEPPRLNTEGAGPASSPRAGQTKVWELGPEPWSRLTALAKQCEVTPFAVLHTAVALVLAARTGQTRLLLGTAAHARPVPELDQVVGFFTNTVPLPTDLSEQKSARDLIRDIWAADLVALEHAELPYDRIAALAPRAADESAGSLLSAVVALQQDVPETVQGHPEMHWQLLAPTAARFDLSWEFTSYRDQAGVESLRLRLEHALDLVDAASADQLFAEWQAVLERMLASPETPLDPLRAVVQLGATAASQPLEAVQSVPNTASEAELVGAFFAAAAQHPDRLVVVSPAESLTYRVAAEQVRKLAGALRRRGVGPDDVVAYVGPRSHDLLVVPLAVMAAGGTYLPIDIENPAERTHGILSTAAPSVVVTRSAQRHLVSVQTELIDLDRDESWAEAEDSALDPIVQPQQGAYLIFTSGSTGKPKGVRVSHRSLAVFMDRQRKTFGDFDGMRVVQFAAVGFDAYIWELVLTVVCAGTLLVPSRDQRLPGEPLASFLKDNEAQWFCAPPTVLAAMSPADVPAELLVVSAGERCPAELTEIWAPGRRMLNAYGPTEATVCVTIAESLVPGVEPTIGLPVGGTELLVLDDLLRQVPVGQAGELYVSGEVVAREYFGRADLTAERFVPDLGGKHPGGRMYRTGDVVAWTESGELKYFGRSDDQVKIRGVRVEPGEARAVLLENPEVLFAEVVPKDDPTGQRQLVAYLVVASNADTATLMATLRTALEEELPPHFVPRHLVLIDTMPRTLNGKLDVKALPEPEEDTPLSGQTTLSGRAAQTPVEQTLCQLIAELLNLDTVCADDDFLRLGGDSILAVTLAGRAKHAGLVLTARQVLELRTAERLAAIVKPRETTTSSLAHRDSGTRLEAAPKQHTAEAFGAEPFGTVALPPVARWMMGRVGDLEGFTQSFTFRSSRLHGQAQVEALISGLVERHPLLNAVLEGQGSTATMMVPAVGLPVADLVSAGKPTEDPADPDSWDAAQLQARVGRCLRARWWPTAGALIVTLEIHHLVVDGVSWRIILDDIDRLLADTKSDLTPSGTSYRNWMRQAQAAAHSAELLDQATDWSELRDAPAAAALLDLGVMSEAHQCVFEFDAANTEQLLAAAQVATAPSLDSVIFTAYARALAAVTGRDRILIRREGHGRDLRELSADLTETVGWFTSEWPVLADLTEVKNNAVQDGTAFGVLRYLAGASELQQTPEPDFSFNYLGRAETIRGQHWEGVGRAGQAHFAGHFPQLHLVDLNAIVESRNGRAVLIARFTASASAWGEASLAALSKIFGELLMADASESAVPSNQTTPTTETAQAALAAPPSEAKPAPLVAETDSDLEQMAAQLLFELES